MLGVAASSAGRNTILVAGVAGLAAGAMSMAVGEYVSVSSQRDAEEADIAKETQELESSPRAELKELTGIYVQRGLDHELAAKVAQQLSARDPLAAHLRDELGIVKGSLSRPLQAAWISAASFAMFAMLPILALLVAPASYRMETIAIATLASLVVLGGLGGHLAGASVKRAALRVTIGGALAMLVVTGIGRLLGVAQQ
ncbi:MAG: hypothetical protein JWO36_7333 [Myxococcales bacterium]|nr:hypothetical protein [Myxococcales bacterium]